jgi:hypothetical protein
MENKQLEIEQAKAILNQHGYFTDNLWHIADVLRHSDCPDSVSNEDARKILNNALTNEWVIGEIFYSIGDQLNNK